MELSHEELVTHAEAINRILSDKSVQMVWDVQEQLYIRQWKAAKTLEERELIWARVGALGDLKQALEATVQEGQHTAEMLKRRAKEEELMRQQQSRRS